MTGYHQCSNKGAEELKIPLYFAVVLFTVAAREEKGKGATSSKGAGAEKARRQVLCPLPHSHQFGHATTGYSPTACFLLQLSNLLRLEAMLFEKALPLSVAIIASAGEIKISDIMLM